MNESLDLMLEPDLHQGPFDFGDGGHFQRSVDWFTRVVRARRTRSHPMYVYWNRGVLGLKGLMYRLRAQVDVHDLIRREQARKANWS
jgi:hypothetical protein